MTTPTYPPREQLVLLNEELQGRAELQSAEMEGLDRKASTILAGTGVVLALVVNNMAGFQPAAPAASGPPVQPVPWQALDLYYGALLLLIAALVAGVVALWPRKVKVIPKPRALAEGYYAKSYEETLANLVSIRMQVAELNKNLSVGKVRALRAQMVLMALGGSALVAAFLLKELV